MVNYKKIFLIQHKLDINAVLTIEQISAYSGIETDILYRIYYAGQVIEPIEEKHFSFHKQRHTKPKGHGFDFIYTYIATGVYPNMN